MLKLVHSMKKITGENEEWIPILYEWQVLSASQHWAATHQFRGIYLRHLSALPLLPEHTVHNFE